MLPSLDPSEKIDLKPVAMLQKRAIRLVTQCTPHIGLQTPENLIFELDNPGRTGVDVAPFERNFSRKLGKYERTKPIGIPSLSEPQVVRHFYRLSRMNYCIDTGFYPLGSCTMKYNPRLNEAVARLPRLANSHPLAPIDTVQGSIEIYHELGSALLKLTGMDSICLSPAAGAHGELCGMLTIARAHEMLGNKKKRYVLIPDSAHGTNPSSSAMAGLKVRVVKSKSDGTVDLEDLKSKLTDDVAAMMLTNPNCAGLFEKDVLEISRILHEKGAFLYMDGANYNSFMGRAMVKDLGVDVMHINLHKTFSTPHGSSGPGSGPVVFAESLTKYIPTPFIAKKKDGTFEIIESDKTRNSVGRMKAFYGQTGIIIRALAYIYAMSNGLAVAAGDSVINANYLKRRLMEEGVMPSFPEGHCMHEVLFDDSIVKGTGVSTMDVAKSLLDAGYHPPTVYFPLLVHGALLIEPTESEGIETIDEFVKTLADLVKAAKSGKCLPTFQDAPQATPIKRADDIGAAKNPILTYAQLRKKGLKN